MESFRAASVKALNRSAAVLWWLLCVVLLYAATAQFAEDLALPARSVNTVNACKNAADAALILLPYWLLPGRWRWSILIALWGMSAIYAIDSVYFRFTSECMPLTLLSQAAHADSLLLGSIRELLRAEDALYILWPAIATAAWCIRPIRRIVTNAHAGAGMRCICIALILALTARAQMHYTNDYRWLFYYWNGTSMEFMEATRIRLIDRTSEFRCSRAASLRQSGVAVYMLTELYDTACALHTPRLSAAKRNSLEKFVLKKQATDSITTKNIVFIVVESLNAEAIGQRVGHEDVTPVLDSLLQAQGTISSLQVVPQVRDGISSDGQLLYNLGLLPLNSGAASQNALYGKRLPALAVRLASTHYPIAVFAERGMVWNERDAYLAYGYRRVLTSDSVAAHYGGMDTLGADDATLRYALRMAEASPKPFLMQILTSSTHYPFREKAAPDFEGGTQSGPERDYLRCVRYFDRALGDFINGLRQRGLLENTILIVASDHHMNMDSVLTPLNPIVFIAAGSGHSLQVKYPVAQADIFPTVCDLAGVRSGWRGVGFSILSEDACGAVDIYGTIHGTPKPERIPHMHRAFAASDSMLRSDFFPEL